MNMFVWQLDAWTMEWELGISNGTAVVPVADREGKDGHAFKGR